MPQPSIYDVVGSYSDRKRPQSALARLDFDLNWLRRVELQVIESLRNETVDNKFSRSQSGGVPSSDRKSILDVVKTLNTEGIPTTNGKK